MTIQTNGSAAVRIRSWHYPPNTGIRTASCRSPQPTRIQHCRPGSELLHDIRPDQTESHGRPSAEPGPPAKQMQPSTRNRRQWVRTSFLKIQSPLSRLKRMGSFCPCTGALRIPVYCRCFSYILPWSVKYSTASAEDLWSLISVFPCQASRYCTDFTTASRRTAPRQHVICRYCRTARDRNRHAQHKASRNPSGHYISSNSQAQSYSQFRFCSKIIIPKAGFAVDTGRVRFLSCSCKIHFIPALYKALL